MLDSELKRYVDAFIKHNIDLQKNGNLFCNQIQKMKNTVTKQIYDFLAEAKIPVTSKMKKQLRSYIRKDLEALEREISAYTRSFIKETVKKENTWLYENIAKRLDIIFNLNNKFEDKLLNMPVATVGVVESYGDILSNRYANYFDEAIGMSYVSGSSLKESLLNFSSKERSISRGVVADTETIGDAIGTQYDRMTIEDNSDQFKGYIWTSILDSSTCLACGHLNGKIFKHLDQAPATPMHHRCRCFLIPFTEKPKIPMSYETWLKSQDDKTQKEVLGKTRYDLFKLGVNIDRFVNNNKILTIDKIKGI